MERIYLPIVHTGSEGITEREEVHWAGGAGPSPALLSVTFGQVSKEGGQVSSQGQRALQV